jgi:very-short-patch-repair endonuclease
MPAHERPSRIVRGQRIQPEKQAIARRMRRNMTPAEQALWQQLRNNKLDGFHFRRQQVIDGFIVDFYCHRAGLAVEVDGDAHDTLYDMDRDLILRQRGIRVIRFRNEQIFDEMERVLSAIREYLHDNTA